MQYIKINILRKDLMCTLNFWVFRNALYIVLIVRLCFVVVRPVPSVIFICRINIHFLSEYIACI